MGRLLIALLFIGAAFGVYYKQQQDVKNAERQFYSKVIEVKNHKFDIPPIPVKDPELTLSAADLAQARKKAVSPSIDDSIKAIESLWKIQDEAALPSIRKILGRKYSPCYKNCDGIAEHKVAMIAFLDKEQTKINLKLLLSAMNDSKPEVREAVATALGNYMCEEVIPYLQKLMVDKNLNVSTQAWNSLERVKHSMEDWKKNAINGLVSEYAKTISRGDIVGAEKKLHRIVHKIEKESEANATASN